MPPIDLNVPFHEKDDAKRLGARWDTVRKTWFLSNGTDVAPFTKWLPQQPDINYRSSSYFLAQSTRICWHCSRDTRVFSNARDAFRILLRPVCEGFSATATSITCESGYFERMKILR